LAEAFPEGRGECIQVRVLLMAFAYGLLAGLGFLYVKIFLFAEGSLKALCDPLTILLLAATVALVTFYMYGHLELKRIKEEFEKPKGKKR